MRTIFDGKSRWLAGVLTVLGGSVSLSACGSAAPTAPDMAVTGDVSTAQAGTASAQAANGFVPCPDCYLLIDTVSVPGNTEVTVFGSAANRGTQVVGNMHLTVYMFAASGLRVLVAEADEAGPRPHETVH